MAASSASSIRQPPTSPTSAPPSPRTRHVRAAQVLAALSTAAGLWLAVSAFALPYPFTVEGVDARLREMGLALVIGILSAGRVRAPVTAWRSGLVVLAAGLVLAALPFLTGVSRHGNLSVAWWNELLTGAAVVVTAAGGLWTGRAATRAPRRPA